MPPDSHSTDIRDSPAGAPVLQNVSQGSNNYGETVASSSTLFQGNFSNFTYNSAAPPQPDFRGEYSFASRRPVNNFVARPALQKKLEEQLYDQAADHDVNKIPSEIVVYGSGGMGKSQLVLKYLETHRPEYLATFWVAAESQTSIERDFTQIYRLLFGKLSVKATDLPGVDDLIVAAKSWFGGRKGKWLFVFDNADSITDERQDHFVDLRRYIPRSPGVYAIITTRPSSAKDLTEGEAIKVGRMETNEACELFTKSAKLSAAGQEGDVKAIMDELGCCALAVNLASHYVSQTPRLRKDLSKYLPEYRQARRELLARKPKLLIHQYDESVLTTWETSFAAVERRSREAARLLGVLACLSPNDIFQELFWDEKPPFKGAVGNAWVHLVFCGENFNLYQLEECLRLLQDYSLLDHQETMSSYEMHPLIQTWGLERLGLEEQREYALSGLEMVASRVREESLSLPDRLRLLPHASASVYALQGPYKTVDSRFNLILPPLWTIARFFDQSGKNNDCVVTYTLLLTGHRLQHGDKHEDTIQIMSELALTLKDQGKLEESVSLLREVLQKWRSLRGDQHSSTIWAMNYLADALRKQNKLDESASLLKDVVEKSRRFLKDKPHATIAFLGNLAVTLALQGKLDQAVPLHEEVLEKRKRLLGSEHLDSIKAENNLANMLVLQEKFDKAEGLQYEVLEKRRRLLGTEHPDTINAQHNLANTFMNQGRLDKAALIQEEVLEKRLGLLGREHPDTTSAQHNLAITLLKQGKLGDAASLQHQVLEMRKHILGNQHADTILAMHNMAYMLRAQDKLDEAIPLQNAAVDSARESLGNDHPHTVNAILRLRELEQLRQQKMSEPGRARSNAGPAFRPDLRRGYSHIYLTPARGGRFEVVIASESTDLPEVLRRG